MTRTEALLIGFIALLIIGGLILNTVLVNTCRSEALKAGKTADEITMVCR